MSYILCMSYIIYTHTQTHTYYFPPLQPAATLLCRSSLSVVLKHQSLSLHNEDDPALFTAAAGHSSHLMNINSGFITEQGSPEILYKY